MRSVRVSPSALERWFPPPPPCLRAAALGTLARRPLGPALVPRFEDFRRWLVYDAKPVNLKTRLVERLRDSLLQSGRRTSDVESSALEILAREGLLSSREKDAFLRVEPIAELLFLVVAADELVADTELLAIRGAVRGLSGDILTDATVQVMVESFALRLRDEGAAARLAAVTRVLASDRNEAESAFCLAAAVALADSSVSDSESRLMDELAASLGITAQDRERILGEVAQDKDGDPE